MSETVGTVLRKAPTDRLQRRGLGFAASGIGVDDWDDPLPSHVLPKGRVAMHQDDFSLSSSRDTDAQAVLVIGVVRGVLLDEVEENHICFIALDCAHGANVDSCRCGLS